MSGTGDLRAVLDEWWGRKIVIKEEFLAALAAAGEPLVATVEVGPTRFFGTKMEQDTVRIVAVTEDVLRARLREAVLRVGVGNLTYTLIPVEVDAIVQAIFGGDDA